MSEYTDEEWQPVRISMGPTEQKTTSPIYIPDMMRKST